MSNPFIDLFKRDRKPSRWLRFLKTLTEKREPSAAKQRIDDSLIGLVTVAIALVIITWLFVLIVAPMFPAPRSTLAQSEMAADLTALTLRNFLPGHDVRIERQFAYNLKLYVDRKSFEDIPYPDRNNIVEKIGRLWCNNIEYPWLPRVSVFDIRSGERLATHLCAFGRLKEIFSKSSSQR